MLQYDGLGFMVTTAASSSVYLDVVTWASGFPQLCQAVCTSIWWPGLHGHHSFVRKWKPGRDDLSFIVPTIVSGCVCHGVMT